MSQRLQAEVWALQNCCGCGLCVAACSKQVLGWNGEDHPVLEQRTKYLGYSKGQLDSCTFCEKFCEQVCPRLDRWSEFEARTILAAKARGPIQSGEPNDVIRAILAAGRSAGLLDGVLMLDLEPWELKPVVRIAYTVEDIVNNLGPQYLWAPVFDQLNQAVYDWGMQNLAVVGTPCTAQAVRQLRRAENPRLQPYQRAIRLSIAIFCTGIYRPDFVDEVLLRKMGLSRQQIKRLEVSADRAWLRAILWDDSERIIPRQEAEAHTRSGCASCDDYLGESADIAVGALGAPAGASTLISRTPAGDIFIQNALKMRLLETGDHVDQAALATATSEKDRRERAKSFQDLRVLMLDALADPEKRDQAIQQFVRLYRTPAQSHPKEVLRSSCTGC